MRKTELEHCLEIVRKARDFAREQRDRAEDRAGKLSETLNEARLQRGDAVKAFKDLLAVAFPEIEQTQTINNVFHPAYGDEVAKTFDELKAEFDQLLEQRKFDGMTQKQKLQYLFEQKGKA